MTIEFRNPAAIKAAAEGDVLNALIASTPGAIERSEAAGQAQLVASTDMPVKMSPSREAFEKLGFSFGEARDELFLSATLPSGWAREATDHAMHSTIKDAAGRERVRVFYKAAFYDRHAEAWLIPRFHFKLVYGDGESELPVLPNEQAAAVYDRDTVVFVSKATEQGWSADDPSMKAAREWLDARYPEWGDPTAYWDEP